MKELLKKLSESCGISGFEENVREIIKDELDGKVDSMETDIMGNVITTHKGVEGKPSVMLASHMDEIGLMVSYIDDEGFIRFVKIGGINDQMLLNQQVYIQTEDGEVPGVIGSKPPHITSAEEAKKIIPYQNMFIDIGANSKEQAEELVSVGDAIVFHTEFRECLNDLVMGKALDNRVGCAVMVEVMKQLDDVDATVYGVGTVQEEVGLKGAKTSAFKLNPDMAIALDVTISGDHPGVKPEDASVKAGKGPVISLADASGRGLITHPMMKKLLIEAAEAADIEYQVEVGDGGTTDATAIHLTREGIATATLSSASRYIHTPTSVVNMKDVEDTVKLIVEFLKRL
ncbi:MAG: M42 family metallopeptidase [Methanosphaera sp.]|uniref:M42 family metallopeptidase n=1 Tax=Methanosphaera sp. TaxID=2666342 RepID=UPI0025E98D19|nr:M42 family metallopeptidase [Methanosphaera sp.]MCI5866489.1 M42 family metallopeptidase [Methanosphaera sp.]MDD6534934.1 M42 family metallopeptidase [Methanosphaera sp.]MDY3955393.1 M42 family metallopeptidase [Methanosphaera sp.]